MKFIFRIVLSIIALSTWATNIWANSYIYIQGDKKTAIYVKVEGQMMPRLGLHYAIIPNLGAGNTRIEILFQENKYPPHQFVINVPENGARGFLLTPVNEKQYALYDLQSKLYIQNGNKQDEAYVEVVAKEESYFSKPKTIDTNTPSVVKVEKKDTVKAIAEKPASRFLDEVNLEVKQDKNTNNKSPKTSVKKDNGIVKSEDKATTASNPSSTTTTAAITCNEAMTTPNFEDFAGKMYALNDDESKLKYLRKNAKKHCYNTQQAGILAGLINGQSARYETLQLLYPKVVDKTNYEQLDGLFITDFMKDKFKAIYTQ